MESADSSRLNVFENRLDHGTVDPKRRPTLNVASDVARNRLPIYIASTFTVDSLRVPLQFWMDTLNIDADVRIASYSQVMQELLDPQSLMAGARNGFDILVIRIEDWIRDRPPEEAVETVLERVRAVAHEFSSALRGFRTRTSASILVLFCPSSISVDSTYRAAFDDIQNTLTIQFSSLPSVYCVSHEDILRLYPLTEYEDPRSDRLGHIPYTPDYFLAMGTFLSRRIAVLQKPQYKVIAVDCDNTLWRGICGEDGADGIELGEAHLRLQEFLVRQHDAGMLICLCTKNNPEDVDAVFERWQEMPLREEHIICSRVNWDPKSSNLESLASELNLSLDSFIFIDDNPMECAEVREHCPEVLTLQFPDTEDALNDLMNHVWAFDRVGASEEGRRRTAQYRENKLRKAARQGTLSIEDFIASLELKVEVNAMEGESLSRVAELVQRTNQFNLTTIRRRAGEIDTLARSSELECLTVRVRDRFGDYGLVGAVFFRSSASSIEVDTFVLSCRVLGRGVEHKIVNELARIARLAGRSHVALRYKETARNVPARDFLQKSFGRFETLEEPKTVGGAESTYLIPTAYAESIGPAGYNAEFASDQESSGRLAKSRRDVGSNAWVHDALRLSRLPDLAREIKANSPSIIRSVGVFLKPPRTELESAVARIWTEVLDSETFGVSDDFFDLGGDSLQAVRVVARIGSQLGLELPLHEFFDTPTIENLAEKLGEASPAASPIERVASTTPVPLSWAQQRLWIIDRLDRGNAAYNITETVRIRGALGVSKLQAALDSLVRRHESLRTVVREINGEPFQEIVTPFPLPLTVSDLSGYELPDRGRVLDLKIRHQLTEPFDLLTPPLIRAVLISLPGDEYILAVTMHHIISDGWSVGIFMAELGELYVAQIEGRKDQLESLPLQYRDYSYWQRQWIAGNVVQSQLAYWLAHLDAAPEVLTLPLDRPRPPVQSYRGGSVEFSLDRELTSSIKSLCRDQNVTVAMLLFATWTVLLSKLSGQEDIVVGMPVANRQRAELEGLIGCFVNTLAIRAQPESDAYVSDFLQKIKRVMFDGYANQDVPFERVVQQIRPVRSLSYSPVYQVMFVLQNAPGKYLDLPGASVFRERIPAAMSQFDLSMVFEDRAEELLGTVTYASDLFDFSTVSRWTESLQLLLRQVVADPLRQIGRLSIVSDDERASLTNMFWGDRVEYQSDVTLSELFQKQASRTPDAVAVSCIEGSLTYAELNSRANRLARHLRGSGCGQSRPVGIFVERGLDMVVGLLGALKSGSAYVPLDPSYPPDRLQYMLGDAAPKVVLIQERLRGRLPAGASDVIALDAQWGEISECPDTDVDGGLLGLSSQDLAYIIYTSGSTGTPKGVMVEHRQILNLAKGLEIAYPGSVQGKRIALNASLNFDASIQQLLQLASGCTLFIVPEVARRDGERMLDLLQTQGIDGIDCTPSQLKMWIAAGLFERIGLRLSTVLVGGEAIDADLWNRLARCSHIDFYNVYGPTECTVDTSLALLRGSTVRPHIGRPMRNRRVCILDSLGNPAAIGVNGELYVGGAGVARGYLNRPELTADRFVPDPFSLEPGKRLYKTGDLGRWRADGTIEYLGRNDDQVKIRGFRIELGEIETQLTTVHNVEQAVVLAREDVPGEKRLVAYVVPATESGADRGALSAEALRTYLKTKLPEHMVPSAFVILDRLPLTSSGKVNRRALPAPERGAYATRLYEAPRTQAEEILAEIWQSLLRVERVGRGDNFFELGGHSLLIVQMLERLRRVGLSAEVRRVFESPTLADLASSLTHGTVAQFEAPANRIPPGSEVITPEMLPLVELEVEHIERIASAVPGGAANIQDIYPLAPLQEGILFHHLLDVQGGDTYVVPTVLSVSSRERLQELIEAIQRVIDRHDILRTAVLWEQLPRPVQVVYRHTELPVEEVSLDPDRDVLEQLQEWISPERQRLDLRQAPLMQLRIAADPGGAQWYVLLQLHHIMADNTSYEIMISEVVSYLECRQQELSDSVPYRDHVAQTLTYAGAHDAETFFRAKLGDVSEPTAPFGLLDVHGDGSQIEDAHEELELSLARRIRAQARRLGVSAATLFHAAWGLVVARTSGRDDVVFGSVLLGRLQGNAGAQRILGMFINTLPLRLRLEGVSAGKFVEHTQEELVELLSHEQSSLSAAQRCSGIVGSAPLFSSLLNYRHSVPNLEAEWGSATGISVLMFQDRTNYPITISVDDLGERFALKAQTDRRINPHRMTAYLHTAMRSLVHALESTPQVPVLSLPILPDSERRQVIELFNATEAAYPREKLIHQLFEEQVERTPEAVAVIYEGKSLSYAELNGRANRLAHHLRAAGVGPDQLVGICVERSLEMVVGLLGILKAGGAYLPLDPAYPSERLQYMLADASPRLLLTQARLKARPPWNNPGSGEGPSALTGEADAWATNAEVIALDEQWSEMAQQPASNLSPRELGLQPDHLAYVIYTSGSTGKPKGVMLEHRNVSRLFSATETWFGFNDRDVWTLFHSFAFDFSVWELWGALLYGGRVVVVPYLTARSPEEFYRLICAQGVTVLNQTPSAFVQLIGAQERIPQQRHSLRVVIFGGEALELGTLRPWLGSNGSTAPQLVNMYGITETTVHVTYRLLTVNEIESAQSSVIGRPIPDLQVYLLDAHQQPVPVGVIGEIYVGGAGVARGYLNRPELTVQRFVEDPFSSDSHARLYKTGDLGRWRADGHIEYFGRNDSQVKVRGFRIELGEIEAQLLRCSQVREAVVLAREDAPGEKRLVAYIVPRDLPNRADSLTLEVLRAHLKSVLPDYMIPSAFVTLASLPLTSNGKLDRRALPVPELSVYEGRIYEAPQGEIEEILAGIWQRLLRVERVGRGDNFFELGGHSLLIVQMLERLRRMGLSAEVRRVFESPTLADLAASLVQGAEAQFEVPPNRIPPGSEIITPEMLSLVELEEEHIERIVGAVPGGAANIQDIYPLAPLQEGILFHHLLDDQRGDTYVVPTVLSVSSRERLEELIDSIRKVMDRHDILRTAVLWEQLPRPVQVVYRHTELPVEEVSLDLDRNVTEQLQEWVSPGRQRLDLRRAPLVRLRVAADPHGTQWYVLFQVHHIACDHVTTEIVISEVISHLEGRSQGLPRSAPYRDHVAQALAHARKHDAESFFRGKLADISEPTAPFGLSDVHGDGSQIDEAHEQLDLVLARRIRAQARRLSVSAATLFHAAWGLVVARTSGRDDVVFGSVLLGRLQGNAGAQRVLGMFINTLPLRLRLETVTVQEFVEHTQRELVELLSHEQSSLAAAQRCSGIIGSAPVFSSLLNYRHSVPNLEAEWGSARGIAVLMVQERTNYPITVSVDDLGERFAVKAQTDRRINPHRMAGYLHTAMRSLVEALETAPKAPVLSLSILSDSERRQVIELFNATEMEYPGEKLIHQLFEEQVERTPHTAAVTYDGQSLSYAELNRRANRLARYLRAAGVGPDQLVGICVERGLEMVVGLLGVLKAGGAYLPLDPDYPPERLAYMLKDASPTVVLTQEKLRKVIPITQAEVFSWEMIANKLSDYGDENLSLAESGLTSLHLVYVIYTSGSTGSPKGTSMAHQSMVNLIEWHRKKLPVAIGARVLQFAALSFDVAFQEVFSTVCTGGTLVMLKEWMRKDAFALKSFLRSRGVERLFIPPLMLQSLAECCQKDEGLALDGLKDVIAAGEQLRVSPEVRNLFDKLDACRLHNHYGPTETHVVTKATLDPPSDRWPVLPSIGGPVTNAKTYVLDKHGHPAPIGVTGEIYLSGIQVARGYLRKPELTARRFIADPFSGDSRIRMYKVGDLGRWREDGTLEYVGRDDDQVKIRGFRIELGEVEAQLARAPNVKDAAVLAREDIPGDKRLVAYVVLRHVEDGISSETIEESRAFLKKALPEHMVPSSYVILDSMPVTPNGKLDRRALPPPDQSSEEGRQYEPPQGETEEALAQLWKDLLGIQRVGRDDDFFELGGHSLIGMRLMAKLADRFKVNLPITTVFRYSKFREMAAMLVSIVEASDLSRREGLVIEEGVL